MPSPPAGEHTRSATPWATVLAGASIVNFRPTGYSYLWLITTADRTAAFFALGFGGQLIEVVPQRHLVIVISTYVDLRTGNAVVNPDDVQRLANAIVTGVRRR